MTKGDGKVSLFGLRDDDRDRYVSENDALIERLAREITILQKLTHEHGNAIDTQITEIRKRLAHLSPEPPTDI